MNDPQRIDESPSQGYLEPYTWTGSIVQEQRRKRDRQTWRDQQDEERKARRWTLLVCILGGFLLLVLAGAQIYAWWKWR